MLNPKPSLHIVIPTKGRADWSKQTTLRALLSAGKRVTLVVSKEEAPSYRDLLCDRGRGSVGGLVRIAKSPVEGIGAVRYWITRKLFREERIIMLDDDLHFYQRPDMHMPYLLPAGPMDIRKMLLYMDIQLTPECPMVGVSSRVGNHDVNVSTRYNTRATHVVGYDLQVLRESGIRYRKMLAYEDLDISLQILRSGRTNAVLYNYCWSTVRRAPKATLLLRRSAKLLLENHPEFVTLHKGLPRIAWSKVHENKSDLSQP